MQATFGEFLLALRRAGLSISADEALAAHRALRLLGYADRRRLRDGLRCVLVRAAHQAAAFDAAFDRFFPAAPAAAGAPAEPTNGSEGPDLAPDAGAARDASLTPVDLARLQQAGRALATEQIEHLGQRHVYRHRLLRAAGGEALQAAQAEAREAGDSARAAALERRHAALAAAAQQHLQRQLELHGEPRRRAEHERQLLERRLDRLDLSDRRELQAMAQRLARELAGRAAPVRHAARRGQLDLRASLRANAGHGGTLVSLKWRRRRLDRPRLVALCDTSRSVAVHAGMLMLFLRLLREALGELRVFGFCSDLVEVTGALAGADTEQAVAAALAAPPQGYTDYGQSLASLLDAHGDAIDRRTSVLILGDARCNDLPPRVELLGRLARRSKAIHWLNTEPRKRWDQGDSVIGQYRVHLRSLQACTTLGQLHAAVGGVLRAAR
ncbi:MAG TPA: VWA domain-containing protein [Gammaproteobacteria bacterium]|nr:VWA domain-containing protein [Gammaproteobacteria bacterium]